ncbi:MAG: sugar phosphate isomerase/epimerase, partial [Verrucomicrobiae bacterium]|nr:sugar phosphate isomerase/epimerase [Verrucomicrobiae bacterium]
MSAISRRTFGRQLLWGGISSTTLLPRLLAEHPQVQTGKWRIGHHFWNWDHAWNSGEYLDQRLRLTKETGFEGFEAKPNEIGQTPKAVREKCAALGIACAAIGGSNKADVDFASVAGAGIVRTRVPLGELQEWLDYAEERNVIYVVHPHVSHGNSPDALETREDLLRYLDERPGVYACPDTGHLALCGSDPVKTIYDLGSRCRYIHLKDIRPERVGKKNGTGEKFCELGTGALDLEGVINALESIGYEGWIMVERDSREPDYIQSARNMRAVLRGFGY